MSKRVLGETVAGDASRMSRLHIRVPDVDRAAAFFGSLFGWKFQRERLSAHAEQRLVPARSVIPGAMGTVFLDGPQAAPVRIEFEVADVASVMSRLHRLGGTGDAASAFDDQGVPLAFVGRQDLGDSGHVYASQIAVVILDVPDTARACAFHAGLFQRTFHEVGSGGRWWGNHMTLGIFPAPTSGVRFWCVVGALDAAILKVCQLGGETLERNSMGPYQTCECRDNQGTAFGLWYDPQLQLTWPNS